MKALAVGVAALVLCGGAAAGGFVRARALEPAASFVAGKPVTVWCAKTQAAWRAYLPAVGATETHGVAYPGRTATHLDMATCNPLLKALRRESIYQPALAAVIAILTHEAIHLRGERDEGVTECAAMHEMPRVAVVYFHVVPGRRLRALMAAAWVGYRDEAPAYRTVCG